MGTSQALGDDSAIAKPVNAILLSSINKRASQIVVSRVGERFVIEFEIEGVMSEEMRPPLKLVGPIVERIRHMAALPIPGAVETAYGEIHIVIGADRNSYFAVAMSSAGENVHVRLRAITVAEFAELDRALRN